MCEEVALGQRSSSAAVLDTVFFYFFFSLQTVEQNVTPNSEVSHG